MLYSQKDLDVGLSAADKASVIADCSVKQDDKDFVSLYKKRRAQEIPNVRLRLEDGCFTEGE